MEFSVEHKIYQPEALSRQLRIWRLKDDRVVFTNGCFDILHRGHLEYLNAAAKLGDRLVIGLNSDASVKKLKGETRPVNTEPDRAYALASLHLVDAVVIFDEETPLELITNIVKPDVLVKGGDYDARTIVGAESVKASGGEVHIIPFKEGYSTSGLIDRLKTL